MFDEDGTRLHQTKNGCDACRRTISCMAILMDGDWEEDFPSITMLREPVMTAELE